MLGIIPCAGKAARFNGIPKFGLPIPPHETLISNLIRRMQQCELRDIRIGVSEQNESLLMPLFGTNVVPYPAQTLTMSETVLLAERYVQFSELCIMGMPDTWFEDDLAFPKLVDALHDGADVAVGLFRARAGQHREGGMCKVEGNQVVEVVDKPQESELEWLWGVLAWRPIFWACMNDVDPHIGYALPRAIREGFDVRAVQLDGQYYDCGSHQRYFDLIRYLCAEEVRL